LGLIDLHCHSTASDGSHRPAELAELALTAGIDVLALTDHDTMAGGAELREAATGTGLRVIDGLELSADHEGPGVLHLLIYGADPETPVLVELLESMARGRLERGPRILEKLAEGCGIELAWEDVLEAAKGGVTGKAHIAEVIVARGHAASCDDAFRRYLAWGRPAYVRRLKPSLEQCFSIVAAAGGVPVMAHPILMERAIQDQLRSEGHGIQESRDLAAGSIEERIGELAGRGLRGIEAYYPGQAPEDTTRYLEVVRRHGLIATGGSDFHGERVKPGLVLGRGYGDGFAVPPELVDGLSSEMKKAREAREAPAEDPEQ
jgi:3',5'-nucleoside bisphosphate phosphatase